MERSDALNSKKMKKRERIIPHKRGLLPVSSSTSASTSTSTKTRIHKTINPSAIPAIIQLQRPVFSSLKGVTTGKEHDQEQKSERRRYTTSLDDEDEDRTNKVIRIEFDSSQAPQPFLEPELLQKIMEARRQKKQHEEADEEATEQKRDIPAESNTEREVRRRAAQTDYGSMAIRDRMNVRKRR